MRDRSPAVPLTRTDWGIFLLLAARRGCTIHSLLRECFSADNHDADLMLRAQMQCNAGWSYIRLDSWSAGTIAAIGALEEEDQKGWYLVRRCL